MTNYLRALRTRLSSTPLPQPQEITPIPNLLGDRDLEWTYVAARIGRHADSDAQVLDFGCGIGVLSLATASLGASVLAIDLMPQQFETGYSNIEFRQTDVATLDETQRQFDLIINCSTIEHVGLSGRYDSIEAPDGDLAAMSKMRLLLKPGGTMLLTLPIGNDDVIMPLHRIYGSERLPRLLEGYRELESSFWRKDPRNVWLPCSREQAMAEVGCDHYYGLGAMVLQLA
jgi:SAM-dependent methyltransferase